MRTYKTDFERATHHPLYGRWQAMRQRCQDPTAGDYDRYGGRGITVCEEWNTPIVNYTVRKGGFWQFVDDMGLPPEKGMQLDRIDNDGPYCKENCRWVTRSQNQRNRNNSNPLAIKAEQNGIPRRVFNGRVRVGWDPEKAATVKWNKNREKKT